MLKRCYNQMKQKRKVINMFYTKELAPETKKRILKNFLLSVFFTGCIFFLIKSAFIFLGTDLKIIF